MGRGSIDFAHSPTTWKLPHFIALKAANSRHCSLPKPQTFAGLIVIEEQQNGRYIYSFHGVPPPRPTNRLESPHPIYFLWHANHFLVIRDDQVRVKLEEVLNP